MSSAICSNLDQSKILSSGVSVKEQFLISLNDVQTSDSKYSKIKLHCATNKRSVHCTQI